MKILFMGTPEFAVPSLKALIQAGHEVCGCFCQPDKAVGRHQNKLQPPPVKVCALEHDIPVFQPVKLRDGTALEQIQALAPELIVVAAYGRILPKEILDYPKYGCINVHSSLLPKYRGAAPINWAILNGEQETGDTIMYMAEELDAGDIIAQVRTPIEPQENAAELTGRLAQLGAELLVETVEKLQAGTATRQSQDPEQVTLAPLLSKQLSAMDLTRSAQALHDQVRGLYPWPSANLTLAGTRCKIFSTCVLPGKNAAPGTVLSPGKDGLVLQCGSDALCILELQPDGGKRMKAADYLRGHPLAEGEVV